VECSDNDSGDISTMTFALNNVIVTTVPVLCFRNTCDETSVVIPVCINLMDLIVINRLRSDVKAINHAIFDSVIATMKPRKM